MKLMILLLVTIVLSFVSFVITTKDHVIPKVNCIARTKKDSNTCLIFWGYVNKKKQPFGQLDIDYGTSNKFSPGSTPVKGQPNEFIVGIHNNVFITRDKCSELNQQWKLTTFKASTVDYAGVIHGTPTNCLPTKCSSVVCKKKLQNQKVCKHKCKKKHCKLIKKPYQDCKNQIKELKKCQCGCAIKTDLFGFDTKSKTKKKKKCKDKKCEKKCKDECSKKIKKKCKCIKKYKKVLVCDKPKQKKCDDKCCKASNYECAVNNNSAMKVSFKGGSKKDKVLLSPIELPESVTPEDFYSYNDPISSSVNSGIESEFRGTLENRLWFTFLKHKQNNEMYMMMVADVPNDRSGGSLDYSIQTKKKWSTTSTNPYYYPLVVKDDQSHAPDQATWDGQTLNVTSQWFPCCTDGIVFGGIHGCFNYTIKNVEGVNDKTIAFVQYRNNKRVVYETKTKPRVGLTIQFCPACLKDGKGCHGGYRKCKTYDRCGVCNGDGSTCTVKPSKCTDCGKVNVIQKTNCTVNYVHDKKKAESFILKAQGIYTKGKTVLKMQVKCKHKKDTKKIMDNWVVGDLVCPDSNNPKIRVKTFSQKITLACLYRCYGSKQNHPLKEHHHHKHESILQGIMNITAYHVDTHKKVKTTTTKNQMKLKKVFYSVPCKFHIHSKNCGTALITYNVHQPTCKVKLLKQEWITPWNPKNLLMKIMTCVNKPHGQHTYLSDPSVNKADQTGKPDVEFIGDKTPPCITANKHLPSDKCCQIWSIRTKGGDKLKCFTGIKPLRFKLHSTKKKKCSKGKVCKSKPTIVKIDLVFKKNKVCKPRGKFKIEHKGYKIKLKGPFCDKKLLSPSKDYAPFQRVYVGVKLHGLEKEKCDEFKLKITHAQLCYAKSEDHSIDSCHDNNCKRRIIWDEKTAFEGGDWKTKIMPYHGHRNCSSMAVISFRALLFEAWEKSVPVILEVSGNWHHHLGNHRVSFTKKFNLNGEQESMTAWSSETLLNTINSVKDKQFKEDVLDTYYSTSIKRNKKTNQLVVKRQDLSFNNWSGKACRKKDGCGQAWIIIRCPPHQYFVPSKKCGSKRRRTRRSRRRTTKCNHEHHERPGRCVKRPIFHIVGHLFAGAYSCLLWIFLIFWILVGITGCASICLCPGDMFKPKKCMHVDCHKKNVYKECHDCGERFGSKPSEKSDRCHLCLEALSGGIGSNRMEEDDEQEIQEIHTHKFAGGNGMKLSTKRRKNKNGVIINAENVYYNK